MFTVEVRINVIEGSYNGAGQVVQKQITCSTYEEVARLVGKLLQHLPKGGK